MGASCAHNRARPGATIRPKLRAASSRRVNRPPPPAADHVAVGLHQTSIILGLAVQLGRSMSVGGIVRPVRNKREDCAFIGAFHPVRGGCDELDPRHVSRQDNRLLRRSQGRGRAVKSASKSASKLTNAAKASASDLASNAAETFKSAVEDQKTAGAGAIGDVARAAKDAADNFQDRAPELANAVRTVAGRVEGISNDIRDRSINELMSSVTEFAGQKPMAFFGCGILAGLVISRLFSTSNR